MLTYGLVFAFGLRWGKLRSLLSAKRAFERNEIVSTQFQDDQRERIVPTQSADEEVNLTDQERHLSLLIGGVLVGLGLGRGSVVRGLMLAGIGGVFLHRGISGHCQFYKVLKINAAAGNLEMNDLDELREANNTPQSPEERMEPPKTASQSPFAEVQRERANSEN